MILSTDEARGDSVDLINFCAQADFRKKETRINLKARMFDY